MFLRILLIFPMALISITFKAINFVFVLIAHCYY